MNSIDLLKKLKEIDKSYYSFYDLKKIINLDNRSLKVKLFRLVKQNILKRIIRGVYVLYDKNIDYEYFANNYIIPSYISFEYALSRYGLISEVPYAITLATIKKTRKIKAGNNIIYYRKVQKKLFFGYEKIGNVFIAAKEKAYLDCLYFKLTGKEISCKIESINIKKLNKKIIFEYIKKYPPKIKDYFFKHIYF